MNIWFPNDGTSAFFQCFFPKKTRTLVPLSRAKSDDADKLRKAAILDFRYFVSYFFNMYVILIYNVWDIAFE